MKFLDKPLTLEELEAHYVESEYIGQIALIEDNGTKVLAILDHRDDDGMCAIFAASGRYLKEKDYGKTWWAFPYVENEIDQEKWKPCNRCKYEEEEMRIYYPAEFDGGMAYEYSEAKFCPECGRPLNLEAWAELEKYLRGERT